MKWESKNSQYKLTYIEIHSRYKGTIPTVTPCEELAEQVPVTQLWGPSLKEFSTGLREARLCLARVTTEPCRWVPAQLHSCLFVPTVSCSSLQLATTALMARLVLHLPSKYSVDSGEVMPSWALWELPCHFVYSVVLTKRPMKQRTMDELK